MNITPTRSRRLNLSALLCLASLAAGALCLLAVQWIGSHVDAAGMLHEPFALMVAGRLLLLLGLLAGLWWALTRRR
jgi:Protein of unknown function (DUF3955)